MNIKNFSEMKCPPAPEPPKENPMNKTKRLIGMLGIVLCSGLLGSTTYGQSSVSVGVSVPLPSVEIHVESDFYEPLTPHGEWVVIGSYGRCWRPARVEVGWRPYCNGYWQRTDAGWYWVSDEPWAWATYHYGRWDFTDQYGWYWVPQIQWAPAWVSWHSGGGYIGWAPLLPSVRISASGYVGFNVSLISPRAYVFVEQRRFLEPVRSSTVVVNNTTIINKTTVITNTKIVNNTVINEGPATTVIEKASGRKVEAVPVRELRHKQEAAVISKQPTSTSTSQKKVQPPVSDEVEPRGKKPVAAPASPQVQKPVTAPHESARPAPKHNEAPGEKSKPAPEFKPETKPPTADKQPPPPKADKHLEKPAQPAQPPAKQVPPPARVKPAKPPAKKVHPPAQENPAPSEKPEPNPADKDKDHEKQPKE